MSKYDRIYQQALEQPERFWAEAAKDILWRRQWDQVLDSSNAPYYRWFRGGELNICENALDRHVSDGRGEQIALIYDSPVTATKATYTYRELRDEVARVAGVLKGLGVAKGDRVLIYMPMVPEAVMSMLACARLGAVHSVVFGGFAAAELAARIDDAKPRVILSASGALEHGKAIAYKPLLDDAIEMATSKPSACVILQRPFLTASLIAGRDHDWAQAVAVAPMVDCIPVSALDPCYILYTSGTTGHPKGIVRDTGGHAVALKWTMKAVYDVGPGDVFWAASDVGWVVGHSYIVYGPLLQGCTTILYEGKPVGTPDAGAYWRVISEYKVRALFTAPTAFRAIRRDDHDAQLMKKYDLTSLRTLFLAGERSDPATLEWAESHLKVPVIDHWWQTETGWAIVANCVGLGALPVKHGSPTKAVPGWDVQVLDEGGHSVERGQIGSLVCRLPLPPGTLPTLWNDDARFFDSYLKDFPGFYKTADAGMIDSDGYVYVMARTDDVINVAGHRLSTGVMEEALSALPDVAESAVIGSRDAIKGEVPLGFLVLKANCRRSESEIAHDAVAIVRDRVGPVAAFKTAIVVKRLPKTRSGKILRGTIKKIADGESFKMPATIDDPVILDEIRDDLKRHGFPQDE